MSGSKIISGEPKSGLSPAELSDLSEKIGKLVERIDDINGDKLEYKAEMALKNKFISPAKEKELFDFLKDNSALLDRYANGERTEDLLAGLEKYHQALTQKRNEIFSDPNFLPKNAKADNPGEFKGESSLFKKQAKKFRDVREAGGEEGKKVKEEKIVEPDKKAELSARLEEAYKKLYGLLNDKKEVPQEVYELLSQIENELRGLVKFRGEVSDLAEKMKEKYRVDERSKKEEKKDQEKKSAADKSLPEAKKDVSKKREKSDSWATEDKTQEEINKILEEKMDPASRPYFTEDGVPVGKDMTPEEHPFGERKTYSRDEEKEMYGLEKVGEENKKAEKAKTETALIAARENFVAAEQAKIRAEEEENKLTGVRARIKEFFKSGITSFETDKTRIPEQQAIIGGAQAEAARARDNFLKAQENLKASLKAYRDGEIAWKTAELKAAGKSNENINKELEKYAKDILLAATLREAAKIDSLKADKQIEQMGALRQYINEKAEEFTDWYKSLPVKYKIAVSAGLMVGGGAFGLVGSTAIMSAAFAGQIGLRVLGGSMMTAGAEQLIKISQEKSAEKKLSKEFGGRFLETLKNQNGELDDKLFELIKAKESEKTRRFILSGTLGALVGSGALAQAVRNSIDWIRTPASGKFILTEEVPRMSAEDELRGRLPVDTQKTGMPALGGDAVGPEAVATTGAKAGSEVFNLEVGSRGPEGAIIDHFRAHHDVAQKFGWDGKTDINKWAGTKAHQLWLKSVEGELAKPGISAKLTEHGFSADTEGYAKAMHSIGKGAFVELDGHGNMHLSDKAEFFRAAPEVPGREHLGNVVFGDAAAADEKIRQTVSRLVEPDILADKTFKAAAKVPLGKILETIPAEATADKHALSDFWHESSRKLDLPGSSWLGLTYGDYTKYAEMAKFMRQSIGAQGIERLKNMTVEDFLKTYIEKSK